MAKGKRLCPPGKVLKEGKCVSNKLKKGQIPRRNPMKMEIPENTAIPLPKSIPLPKIIKKKKKRKSINGRYN